MMGAHLPELDTQVGKRPAEIDPEPTRLVAASLVDRLARNAGQCQGLLQMVASSADGSWPLQLGNEPTVEIPERLIGQIRAALAEQGVKEQTL